ncbi:hypothetical protein [Herbaspirillum sp. NPDC101397]|uniref:hypothetical protein n=1 Tax=Herbaspirillum sp. NPDC101397 TaxID=3364006 RepID=UPI00383A35E9
MKANSSVVQSAVFSDLANRINSAPYDGPPQHEIAKIILENNEIFKNGMAGGCDSEPFHVR